MLGDSGFDVICMVIFQNPSAVAAAPMDGWHCTSTTTTRSSPATRFDVMAHALLLGFVIVIVIVIFTIVVLRGRRRVRSNDVER